MARKKHRTDFDFGKRLKAGAVGGSAGRGGERRERA